MLTGLLVGVAVTGGSLITYLLDEDATPLERLWMGIPVGLAALGLAGFASASLLGLTPVTVGLSGALAGVPWVLLAHRELRARVWADVVQLGASLRRLILQPRLRDVALVAAFVLAALVLARVFERGAFVRDGAWFTGIDHNIGDLPFHLGIVQGFALGDNFPPEHPELAGTRLTYPFLADFLAALFVAAGTQLHRALLLENLLLGIALLGLLHAWASRLTRDHLAAAITPALVLLNGGLGWWMLVGESEGRPGGLWGLLARLPHDYTILHGGGLRWGNVVITLLVPQRALLLGLPLFLVAWTLWWRALSSPPGSRGDVRRMVGAGLVAGLLPLAHAHSFTVLVSMGACLALLFRRRSWLAFLAVAGLTAAPQIAWLAHGHSLEPGRFLGWQLGWETTDGNVVGFWLRNAGIFIPLLLLALGWRGDRAPVPARLLRFYLPFTLCFLVPNLVRLSPWIWDNVKFLVYWHVASAPLVALLLARLARSRAGLVVGAAALATLTLAGSLDVWRAASGAVERRVFEAEGVEFARLVAASTPPHARVLTAPAYDHPVLLAGRRLVMGYEGHLWSQGLDYSGRKQLVEGLYAGSLALAGYHEADYVVVGPHERRALTVSEELLRSHPVVAVVGPYRLLRIAR